MADRSALQVVGAFLSLAILKAVMFHLSTFEDLWNKIGGKFKCGIGLMDNVPVQHPGLHRFQPHKEG